jgi:hypothetical protein
MAQVAHTHRGVGVEMREDDSMLRAGVADNDTTGSAVVLTVGHAELLGTQVARVDGVIGLPHGGHCQRFQSASFL